MAFTAWDEAERLRSEQGLPADPALAKNRGVVYGQLGRPEDALGAWDEAERLRSEQGLPADPELHFNRAMVHANLGEKETACRLAREAVEMYKGTPQLPVHPMILEWVAKNCEKD